MWFWIDYSKQNKRMGNGTNLSDMPNSLPGVVDLLHFSWVSQVDRFNLNSF